MPQYDEEGSRLKVRKKGGTVSKHDQTEIKGEGTDGKIVVVVMLCIGLVGAILVSRNMPYSNPAEADEGSPYYSRPTDEQVKILKEKHKNDGLK